MCQGVQSRLLRLLKRPSWWWLATPCPARQPTSQERTGHCNPNITQKNDTKAVFRTPSMVSESFMSWRVANFVTGSEWLKDQTMHQLRAEQSQGWGVTRQYTTTWRWQYFKQYQAIPSTAKHPKHCAICKSHQKPPELPYPQEIHLQSDPQCVRSWSSRWGPAKFPTSERMPGPGLHSGMTWLTSLTWLTWPRSYPDKPSILDVNEVPANLLHRQLPRSWIATATWQRNSVQTVPCRNIQKCGNEKKPAKRCKRARFIAYDISLEDHHSQTANQAA